MKPRRGVRAGRRSTIGNRVCAKSVSGVRIPASPPFYFRSLMGIIRYEARTPRAPSGSQRDGTCFGFALGEVAERLNAAVSKTVSPVTLATRVRIPASPPFLSLDPFHRYDESRSRSPRAAFFSFTIFRVPKLAHRPPADVSPLLSLPRTPYRQHSWPTGALFGRERAE